MDINVKVTRGSVVTANEHLSVDSGIVAIPIVFPDDYKAALIVKTSKSDGEDTIHAMLLAENDPTRNETMSAPSSTGLKVNITRSGERWTIVVGNGTSPKVHNIRMFTKCGVISTTQDLANEILRRSEEVTKLPSNASVIKGARVVVEYVDHVSDSPRGIAFEINVGPEHSR